MAIVHGKLNEIQCKIVYYGPGRCGKTTNLIMIHRAMGKKTRGDLISVNTTGDKTIFFDFLPMDLGSVKDMKIRISVYTVPGQVIYNDTRKLVLRGVDGIVFVADSLGVRRLQNIESLSNLEANLQELGTELSAVPLALQYNKRDLSGNGTVLMPVEQMEEDLNASCRRQSFQASAITGGGVKDTFKSICMMTVSRVCAQLV